MLLSTAVAAADLTGAPPGADTAAVPPSIADRDDNNISDQLEQKLVGLQAGESVDVIVTYEEHVDEAAAQRTVGSFEVKHRFRNVPGFAARMTTRQARALAARAGISRIEEDAFATGQLDVARAAFGVDRARSDWGVTGAGVGICVVDTGILATHEQFIEGGVSKVLAFADFVNGGTTPYDDNGHGTVIAGIAAGDGTGSGLAGGFRGVAPDADLYVAKVLDATNRGAISTIIQGIEWCAAQHGVDVINLSLATDVSSDGRDALSRAVNAVVSGGKIVMAAAGNGGAAPETIPSPAAAALAIAVGAAAEHTSNPTRPWHSAGVYLAPFSARGPTADGRVKPDIVAPGVSVAAAGTGGPQGVPNCRDCYEYASGTSMATAFMSGVAALMLDASPAGLTAAEVRQLLFASAQPRGSSAGKDNEWGFGLLDAFAAVGQARQDPLGGAARTAFPGYALGNGSVGRRDVTYLPVTILDPTQPLAITITLEGRLRAWGWKPDLEARLLDGSLAPVIADNAESTCPAGAECGAVGRQETLYLRPPLADSYVVEIWPDSAAPNRGAGGDFIYELSNARSVFDRERPNLEVFAEAGTDLRIRDADRDGRELVELDGSASGPADEIAAWTWSWADETGTTHVVDGIAPVVEMATGRYEITLTVTDRSGLSTTDSVSVWVKGRGGRKNRGGTGGTGGDFEFDDRDDEHFDDGGEPSDGPLADVGDDHRDRDDVQERGQRRSVDNAARRTENGRRWLATPMRVGPSSTDPHGREAGPIEQHPDTGYSDHSRSASAGTSRPRGSASWAQGRVRAGGTIAGDAASSDNRPDPEARDETIVTPLAEAGHDRAVVDVDADGIAWVELDGRASGPLGTIASWTWSWTDRTTGTARSAIGMAPTIELPVGDHVITLEVADAAGTTAQDRLVVSVVGEPGAGPTIPD